MHPGLSLLSRHWSHNRYCEDPWLRPVNHPAFTGSSPASHDPIASAYFARVNEQRAVGYVEHIDVTQQAEAGEDETEKLHHGGVRGIGPEAVPRRIRDEGGSVHADTTPGRLGLSDHR